MFNFGVQTMTDNPPADIAAKIAAVRAGLPIGRAPAALQLAARSLAKAKTDRSEAHAAWHAAWQADRDAKIQRDSDETKRLAARVAEAEDLVKAARVAQREAREAFAPKFRDAATPSVLAASQCVAEALAQLEAAVDLLVDMNRFAGAHVIEPQSVVARSPAMAAKIREIRALL